MSKFRSFKKMSSIALAIVLTISCLSTVLVANAASKIGWSELGVTEDTTYDTAGATQVIGTASSADFSNLEFEGIINLGSSGGQVKFGFGDNGTSKAFYIQGNAVGSAYLKWGNKNIRFINIEGEGNAVLEQTVQNVDLLLKLKFEFYWL